MTFSPFRKASTVCAGLSAAALIAGMAAPAQGTTTGWRQVFSKHYGTAVNFSGYETIVAPSKTSAWALGDTDLSNGNGTTQAAVAERWNGTGWTSVSLPAGVTGPIIAASAPSATDIWAVTFYGGDILHWNGVKWSLAKHVTGTGEFTGVTALSASNVWVFGGPGSGPGLGTWHYNGSTWSHMTGSAVGLVDASPVSATSIWAIGSATSPDDVIQHYNGSSWKTVTAPALSGLQFQSVHVFSATNVWVSAVTQGGASPSYLLHYNGSVWLRHQLPWNVQPGAMTSDGNGGILLTGQVIGSNTSYIVHRTYGGVWSRTPVAAHLENLTLIPGTASAFAVGFAYTATGGNAVVWAHGTLP